MYTGTNLSNVNNIDVENSICGDYNENLSFVAANNKTIFEHLLNRFLFDFVFL